MKETQPGGKKSQHCGRFMDGGRKGRGRAWLVVVFQKTRQFVLVVQPGQEVLANRTSMALAKAVVQPFVVGVIESLLLQGPFQVPVNFGHEDKTWRLLSH